MRDQVSKYLKDLQDSICNSLSEIDGSSFVEDAWQHTNGSGGGRTRVLSGGHVIEKGGVNFSHVMGEKMPPAATQKRPELAGKPFEAMGVSLVIHPRNPLAPTSHMNVRFFVAGADTDEPIWWFGGGFDMTPYYGFEEDAKHWHQTALEACQGLGSELYPKDKGGLFFDDLNEAGFEQSFAFMQSIGDHFIPAYTPILNRRKDSEYTQAQRDWQLLRRGRYVEFNLVFDRGTLFGLQSGGRTESILMSMPPMVAWEYRADPEPGSEEAKLLSDFIVVKDWLT